MVCMINKDIDLVQMGEVIWNSHEYIPDPKACFQNLRNPLFDPFMIYMYWDFEENGSL